MPRGEIIPVEKREKIINLWMTGNTYRSIQKQTGVSLSTISSIINMRTKKEPDIKELRQLKIVLKKIDASPSICLRGARLLEELNNLDVSLEDVTPILKFCETVEEPSEAANYGLELAELQRQTGKDYWNIIDDWKLKNKQVERLKKKIEKTKGELDSVNGKLRDLKELEKLQIIIDNLGLSPTRLHRFIEDAVKIERNGFKPEIAAILSSELKKIGLDPALAATRIVDLVEKYGTLHNAVSKLLEQKSQVEQKFKETQSQKDHLHEIISKQKDTIARNKDEIKDLE